MQAYGQPQAYQQPPTQAYGQPQPYQQPSYPAQFAGQGQPNQAANFYNHQYNYAAPTTGYPQAPQGLPQPQHNGSVRHYSDTAPQFNGTAPQRNSTAPQFNGTAPYNGSAQQFNGTASQPNGVGSRQNSYGQQPPATYQATTPASQQGPIPTTPWQQQGSYNQAPRHNSAPSLSNSANFEDPTYDDGDPSDGAYVSQEANELETPYYGAECPYARSQNEIDPALSIGEVVYHPALPTRRPLPATFNEAEVEALAPRIPRASDLESISDYFINSRREDSLLDIRQTDRWEGRRNDPIFREFPVVPEDVISPEEMAANWRDRADPTWTDCSGSPSPEPEPEPKRIKRENTANEQGIKRENTAESQDVLGNLEKALEHSNNSLSHTNNRGSFNASQSIDRPLPMGIVRDRTQEDILASLGVTGSPKMAFQTPGPARSSQDLGGPQPVPYSRTNSISSDRAGLRGSFSRPPPPPPPAGSPPYGHGRSQSYGNWFGGDRAGSSDLYHHHGRSGSAASNHTAAGSDFAAESEQGPPVAEVNGTASAEDLDRTPRAGFRSENRKRGREGGDESGGSDDSGAENDTPRPGRKLARYSR